MPDVVVRDLGRIRYAEAWHLQRRIHELRAGDACPDHLLLCEHEPVITMGKSGRAHNLLMSPAELARRGVDYFEVERGGDLTYHGPGQIVGYPILRLPRLREVQGFVRKMEEVVIQTLASFGIAGVRRPDHPGVFVADAKIASIGATVRRSVTFHGFALDVCTDVDHYRFINPCGMPGVRVTTMAGEIGRTLDLQAVKAPLLNAFAAVFDARLLDCEPEPKAGYGQGGLRLAQPGTGMLSGELDPV